MTEEEHLARAMLLGFKFSRKGWYYVDERGSGSIFEAPRYDAETLAPVTWEEAKKRLGWGQE